MERSNRAMDKSCASYSYMPALVWELVHTVSSAGLLASLEYKSKKPQANNYHATPGTAFLRDEAITSCVFSQLRKGLVCALLDKSLFLALRVSRLCPLCLHQSNIAGAAGVAGVARVVWIVGA